MARLGLDRRRFLDPDRPNAADEATANGGNRPAR
jgi:hypothetical protein